MPDQESFILDGLDLSNAVPLGIRSANLDPPAARLEWARSVDTEASLLIRDSLHEDRVIELAVQVQPRASMDLALAQIVRVRDKLKKASATKGGIGLVWTPAKSTLSCTFTVFAGEITGLPIDWEGGWLTKTPAPTMNVRLYCHPYWKGTEVTTSTASTSTPFVTLEIANVPGDINALGRIIVTDTASQSRRHVEWGLEGPTTYNASTSLIIDSDDMVTSGFAGTQSTATGAYDPNASGNSVVTCTPVPGQPTAVCGTGNLSHVGNFRVKARVQSTSLSNLFRLSWRSGDGPMTPNDWVTPTSAAWLEIDLGMINISAVTTGTQRWTGQIEVQGAASSPGSVIVDYLLLFPVNEGYGVARAEYTYLPGVVVAYDQFDSTTAGNALNARAAPLGGSWATSGAATDLVFSDAFSGEQITRSASGARDALLGTTTYTNVEVSAWVTITGTGVGNLGLDARYTDASNNLTAFIAIDGTTNLATLSLVQLVAAVSTQAPIAQWTHTAGATYRIRVIVYATGHAIAHVLNSSGTVIATSSFTTTALATGGTLATGKAGVFDQGVSGSTTRYYDDVYVSTPAAEPIAIYSGRTLQFRYDDTIRDDSTGTYTGRPKSYEGARVTIPVGTSRVIVKAKRNDVEAYGVADDTVTDATQIQIAYTPRGLVVPR